ncbi:hypothetical protein ACSW9O_15295 (plasmid) [Clostridium perfringens]
MKLKKAIKIGKECGLETIGEAILNIDMHSMNIFSYDEILKEIGELYRDFKNSGLSENDLLEEVKL